MNRFFRLGCVVMAAAALVASCSKDKASGTLSFDSPAAFLQPGEEVTVKFAASNVNLSTLSVTTKPTGWSDPYIDTETKTLSIVAPKTIDDEVSTSGSLVLSGSINGGSLTSATLFVGVVDQVDLSSKQANSFLLNQPKKNYRFDAIHKGDGTSSIATASVAVIWQSKTGLIQYLQFENGEASFYIGEGDTDKISEGNALIGAYDANGVLLWSWHIWAADYDPSAAESTVDFNGYTLMNRNLGALKNDNTSEENILASYGLYYQWGRKEPFIGPSTYQASNGTSATMYNASGSRVVLATAASSAETGTPEYATQNPLVYILGVEGSKYDWMWSAHSDALWADRKTLADPCPAGWQVAPAAAFAGLTIKEPLSADLADTYYNVYGWTLTDGVAESLFLGAGRRSYHNSTIQNIYPNSTRNTALYDQPWVGYYWTTTSAADAKSAALYFWFNKLDVATSGIDAASAQWRSNGMQIRCVKTK